MNRDFADNSTSKKFKKMLDLKEVWYFDVDDFCNMIDSFLDDNDLNFAEKALFIFDEQHPKNSLIELKRLEYFLVKEDVKESKNSINRIYALEINNPDFILCLGKYYSLTGKSAKSIFFFKKAIQNYDDVSHVYNLIANEYILNNKNSYALKYLKKSLFIYPNDEFILQSLVDCYDRLGRIKNCILFLNQFINRNPYSSFAWHQLGVKQMELDEYEKAIESFGYENLIKPESANPLFLIGECYETLEDYPMALATYQELKLFEEHKATVNFKIGDCYSKMHEYEKGISHYKLAVYYDPHLDKAWYAKSLNYEKLNNFLESKYSISKALQYEHTNLDYLRQSAYIHIELGEYEEAEERFKVITHNTPQDVQAWFTRSEILIVLGEYQIALEVLEKASKTVGENAKLLYQKSYCYHLLGNSQNSKSCLEKAERIKPNIVSQLEKEFPHFKKRNSCFIKNIAKAKLK